MSVLSVLLLFHLYKSALVSVYVSSCNLYCAWMCRYTENTKSMLQSWFDGKTFPDESFYIVREGKLADQYS